MYELIVANKNYSSWSMRPWVLMRGLEIPFRERLLPFHENKGQGDFKLFSPTGRVPCLVDGALRVWDSLAIAEYLAERHVGVWPSQPDARAFARCASAEMHSGFAALRQHCSMTRRHAPAAAQGAGGGRAGSGATGSALDRGPRTLRRTLAGGLALHQRGCLLCAGRHARADL